MTAHIGQSHRRENARRHLAGRGRFVSDMVFPRMLHTAFVRSPMAKGRIINIELDEAKQMPGVMHVFTAKDLNTTCAPWTGTLEHFINMQSATMNIFAEDKVYWAGQPVAMVLARSRAEAEDACEMVYVEIEDEEAVTGITGALQKDACLAHDGVKSNLCYENTLKTDDVNAAFAKADHIVEESFIFGRHTAVTLEPRSIVADFDQSTGTLTVHHGTQTPYQFQDVYARHFGLPEGKVRVIAPDVGGSFGMKLHVYNEEMAVVAASLKTGRPVRFIADRLESFVSDIHARDHHVYARMALDAKGNILAMDVDDKTQIGAVSTYPRTEKCFHFL